jgi:hypothetical protein
MNVIDKPMVKGIAQVDKYRLAEGETEEQLLKRIEKGLVKPYETKMATNLWLTTGWTELLKLITGDSASHFDSTNAQIGVGNDSTAAAAGQTDLIGASTSYKGMESGYPTTPAGGSVQFRAKFLTSEANFAWQEAVIKNSSSAICWNRYVNSWGTKSSSEVWYLTATLGVA